MADESEASAAVVQGNTSSTVSPEATTDTISGVSESVTVGVGANTSTDTSSSDTSA